MKRKTKSEKWEIMEYMEDDTPKKWVLWLQFIIVIQANTQCIFALHSYTFSIHWNRAVSIELSVCHFSHWRRRWWHPEEEKKTQIIIQYLDAANDFRLHGNCATIIFCYLFRCHSLRTYTRDADAQQCRHQRRQKQHTIRQANTINHLINWDVKIRCISGSFFISSLSLFVTCFM